VAHVRAVYELPRRYGHGMGGGAMNCVTAIDPGAWELVRRVAEKAAALKLAAFGGGT
jgi:hypothetical protein